MKKYLFALFAIGLFAIILNGCALLPKDNSQTETMEDSLPYYRTWEVKDYQSGDASALPSDVLESFRGTTVTYQVDAVILDGEKVTDEDLIYKTDDTTYSYDSFTETFQINLGEWWNQVPAVTCITIASEDHFFGDQFFVADSDTIWIYYEGVCFLAKAL